MRIILIIFSTFFSISSHLVHASTMLEEDHRDSPVPSIIQTGVPVVPQDNYDVSHLFSQRLAELIQHEKLTEDEEKAIQTLFKHEDFEMLSRLGWEAEQAEDFNLAFYYRRAAALGNLHADQEKLSYDYFEKKDYKNAARWYLQSALNENSDILAELHRIDKEIHILQYLNPMDLPQAMDILEEYWKNQVLKGELY